MSILFITEQGSRLVKNGYSLVVKKDNQRVFLYPLEQITQLVLVGRVEITSGLLGYLMQRGIDTVFLRTDGKFKGRVSGATGKNILLREKQFRLREQSDWVLDFSRSIVAAKIRNTAYFLRKASHGTWEELRERIQNALVSVEKASNLEQLLGLEGGFSNLYFGRFSRLLKHDFGFRKRVKHPPTDPVNILLSLGYTLLFNTLYGLVEAAGFDPYAGIYHQTSYGHAALVSDLMEPYRAVVIDQLVVQLINNETIKEKDFQQEEKQVKITPEGLRLFVQGYRNRLFARQKGRKGRHNFWQYLQKEVWSLQKYIMEEQNEYRPTLFR